MPSWSGSHMWRTISIGHSSRSSSLISVSSGSFFFAKSRSDFRLSFRVFGAIMTVPSMKDLLRSSAAQFANLVCHFRQELQDVIDNSDIGDLEDRGLGIFVYGDDERISFEPREVL